MCGRIRTQDCPQQQTEPWGLPAPSVCQVTSGSKGLERLWGAAAGGMRGEREFRGQMVMHKKLIQTKSNPKKANALTPDIL